MLQSPGYPVPNCVLGQSRLDSIRRASLNRGSDNEVSNSSSSSSDEDSNSDLSDQYQEMVHLNGPQRTHRREGIARLDSVCHTGFDLPIHKRASGRDSQIFTHPEDRHHLYLLGASQHQTPTHCQQQRTQPTPLPPQQQPNHRQRHDPYASSGAFRHHLSQLSLRSDPHGNGRHYHHSEHQPSSCSQPTSEPRENLFPPLHDSPSKNTVNINSTHLDQNRTMTSDYSLNQRMAPIRPMREQNPKTVAKQRPLPPPLTIPTMNRQSMSSPGNDCSTDMSPASAVASIDTKLSPSAPTSSPESPSSLAIHLYVHHHHHHPNQGTPLTSAILGIGASKDGISGGSPASLLSPLTIPLVQPAQPLPPTTSIQEQGLADPSTLQSLPRSVLHPSHSGLPAQSQQRSVHSNQSLTQLLESIPSAASSDCLQHQQQNLLRTRPIQLIQRKPSLPSAPTFEDGSQEFERPGHRGLLHHPLLSNLSAPKVNPSVPSLPAVASIAPVFSTLIPSITRMPPRRHRPPQPQPRLFDPISASHLLSTISSKDLARLYVHAAHHLHSHQPIYRYVLMKMMMTQAEFVQYGRLRAEMPRTPGPSTGARPKRIGFGTEANTGMGARPKKPSRLGLYVVNGAGNGRRGSKHEKSMVESSNSGGNDWLCEQGGQRRQRDSNPLRMSRSLVQRSRQNLHDNVDSIGRKVVTAMTTTTMTTTSARSRGSNTSLPVPERRGSWSQSLACLASLSNKNERDIEGTSVQKKSYSWYGIPSLLFAKANPKSDASCAKAMLLKVKSESDLVYSPRRLEELELGVERDDDSVKVETSLRQKKRSWSRESNNRDGDEEDEEDEDGVGEEHIRFISHSENPYQEPEKHVDVRSYWTLWRRKLQHQGGGHGRQLVRTVDPSFSGEVEMRAAHSQQHYHQQRPPRHSQSSLQYCNSRGIYSTSASSIQLVDSVVTASNTRLMSHDRENMHNSSLSTNAAPVSVSTKYQQKIEWQNRGHLDPHGNECALSSSIVVSTLPSFGSGASTSETTTGSALSPSSPSAAAAAAVATSALTEPFGYSYSGLLMVSVLFCFLCLIEGSNQFINIQAALLSIIL